MRKKCYLHTNILLFYFNLYYLFIIHIKPMSVIMVIDVVIIWKKILVYFRLNNKVSTGQLEVRCKQRTILC